MGILTTYTCDRCAASSQDNNQMWELGLTYRHVGQGFFSPEHLTLFCRGCMEELGLLPAVSRATAKAKAEAVDKSLSNAEVLYKTFTDLVSTIFAETKGE